jgi:hypothetical protein
VTDDAFHNQILQEKPFSKAALEICYNAACMDIQGLESVGCGSSATAETFKLRACTLRCAIAIINTIERSGLQSVKGGISDVENEAKQAE